MNLKKLLLITILVFAAVFSAFAGVNLKNGNFYITYSDFVFDDKFKIERTYNSKSTGMGIFGYGWNSDYETYLVVLPDKSIMVHEYGSGGKTRFEALKPDKQNYEAGVQQIIEIAKKLKEVESAVSIKELEEKLRKSVEQLEVYWQKYRKKGLVEMPAIAVGTVLESRERGFQSIKRTSDGFLRTSYNETKEYFNKNGLLTRIVSKNGDFKTLVYDENENLKSITDNFGRRLDFVFNANGTVERIEGKKGETVLRTAYKYNAKNHLIDTTDISGNNYKHEYDDSYNMTKILYTDGSSMDIAYHAGTLFTKSVKERDGSVKLYDYKSVNEDNYSTTVKSFDAGGKLLKTNSYEYFIKADEFGNRWTQKIIINENGRLTETEYDKGGQPIVIKINGIETRFEYDAGGRMTRKETSREIIEITYHERLFKITKVVNTNKSDNTKTWTAFQYDLSGNLTNAENSEGKSVVLKYDGKGKIESMQDQDKAVLKFKYNERGKPTEISMDSKGEIKSIVIEYDVQGEISKIESPGGNATALMVTQAFQNLLALVKPAGVNFSF